MRRPDARQLSTTRRLAQRGAWWGAWMGAWMGAWFGAFMSASAPARAEDAPHRHHATIQIEQAAPFMRLPLPASAYGRATQAELRDLRIVDATGERVPFAVLAPRAAQSEVQEQTRDVMLYALPPRPAAGKAWASPLEVTVQGDRISVRPARASAQPSAGGRSPGWLVDLGDPKTRKPDEPALRALRLVWSSPVEFSVGVDVEVSDDLRQWRAGGSSQLLALASPRGPLLQDRVILPASLASNSPTTISTSPTARFVRLVWSDAAAAPRLVSAQAVLDRPSNVVLDPPAEISAAPLPSAPEDGVAKRALVFDLGGALPLLDIELRLAAGTQIAPVRVQGRRSVNDTWSDIASAVFYRIERAGQVSTSPPLALGSTQRYLRMIPDERAAAFDPAQVTLVARAALASLVFARQGREPYTLHAGSADAKPSALPITTLVPALDEERKRFGQATLGAWRESEEAARQLRTRARLTALRPWLLWAVLIAGVAGLGFMVWRLARRA